MRFLTGLTLLALLAPLAGCDTAARSHETNVKVIRSVNDMAIQNAILAQQTLYPYHFVPDGAELNELGAAELAVLAGHYREHPGRLNVRRAATPPDLYQARLRAVTEALAGAGVDTSRIELAEGMPGGDGMPSEQVLMITFRRTSPSRPPYYKETGGSQVGGAAGATGAGDMSAGGAGAYGGGPTQ